jgi:glycine cleavage system H protein
MIELPRHCRYTNKHIWISYAHDVAESVKEKKVVPAKKPGAKPRKPPATPRASKEDEKFVVTSEHSRIATIGITEVLTEKLGEIDSIDLPKVGEDIDIGARCVHIHVGQVVRYLQCPLTGCVTEVNSRLIDDPNLLHLNPYEHWLFKIEYEEPDELELLVPVDRYATYVDML